MRRTTTPSLRRRPRRTQICRGPLGTPSRRHSRIPILKKPFRTLRLRRRSPFTTPRGNSSPMRRLGFTMFRGPYLTQSATINSEMRTALMSGRAPVSMAQPITRSVMGMFLAHRTLESAILRTAGLPAALTSQQMFIRYTRCPRRLPCPSHRRLCCWLPACSRSACADGGTA